MAADKKILVVGAGVVGVTTAEAFHRLGYDVTVVEENTQAGVGTSKANGGQLCPAFCLPFNAPNFWLKLLQNPGNKGGTGFRFTDGIRYANWAIRFILNSSKASYQANSKRLLGIASHAEADFNRIFAEYDINFDHNQDCGKLYIYKTAEPLSAWSQLYELRRELGFNLSVLNVSECIAKEPLLAKSNISFAGGIFVQRTSVGDCSMFTQELSAALSNRGVQFNYGVKATELIINSNKVAGIKTATGEEFKADIVILTSALGTLELLPKKIAKNYPMAPFKGYSLTIPLTAAGPNGTITDASRVVAMSVLGDRLRVSGGVFLDSSPWINSYQLDRILNLAKRYLPGIADYDGNASPWAGRRPTTPSSVPYIDTTDINGLYINAGHGSHGWSLAAASAQIMANLVHPYN